MIGTSPGRIGQSSFRLVGHLIPGNFRQELQAVNLAAKRVQALQTLT
jgi:hypothetical protein